MKLILGSLLAVIAGTASAQSYESRIGNVSFYRTTVGTTTAAAIPGASIGGNVASYKICNDAVNVSTYLIVGEATDAATDGMTLLPGACFECKNCKSSTLALLKVKGQAASNGYSVIQYRE
jgi:hypothetical protein